MFAPPKYMYVCIPTLMCFKRGSLVTRLGTALSSTYSFLSELSVNHTEPQFVEVTKIAAHGIHTFIADIVPISLSSKHTHEDFCEAAQVSSKGDGCLIVNVAIRCI